MKVVEKQLLSNEKQVGSIQSGMADTSQKVAMYTGRADVSQQFGDVHIV
jgi:hypothetical protein